MKRLLIPFLALALLAAVPATAQEYCSFNYGCTDEERLEHRIRKLEERQKALEWCAKAGHPDFCPSASWIR